MMPRNFEESQTCDLGQLVEDLFYLSMVVFKYICFVVNKIKWLMSRLGF